VRSTFCGRPAAGRVRARRSPCGHLPPRSPPEHGDDAAATVTRGAGWGIGGAPTRARDRICKADNCRTCIWCSHAREGQEAEHRLAMRNLLPARSRQYPARFSMPPPPRNRGIPRFCPTGALRSHVPPPGRVRSHLLAPDVPLCQRRTRKTGMPARTSPRLPPGDSYANYHLRYSGGVARAAMRGTWCHGAQSPRIWPLSPS